MSVLIETTKGDLVIDLFVKDAPKACLNFLKLCKIKYYNFGLVYNVQKDFSFQAGDPLYPLGNGGSSIWGLCGNSSQRAFKPEFNANLNHSQVGTVSAVTTQNPKDEDQRMATSQFVVTLAPDQEQLDGRAAVFGQVVEGLDTLKAINQAFCDDGHRPLQDIRIKHTHLLEDPFEDPAGLREPSKSPEPSETQLATVRLDEDEESAANDEAEEEEAREIRRREQEARAQALTLEMVGDLPYAEVKPPENVLFVCKLNPVTQSGDLELIFSRFGKILSCEVIKDSRSGESLQYAFIEFEDKRSCQQAYFKMQDVLIDDSRIHVDFSQSVAKLSNAWQRGDRSQLNSNNGSNYRQQQQRQRRQRSPPYRRSIPRSPSPDNARYSKHRDYRDRDRRYDRRSRHREERYNDDDDDRHYRPSRRS